jgi:hypothetical protein
MMRMARMMVKKKIPMIVTIARKETKLMISLKISTRGRNRSVFLILGSKLIPSCKRNKPLNSKEEQHQVC